MIWSEMFVCVAFICLIGGSVAFPALKTKDDVSEMLSSLMEGHQEPDVAGQIPAEVSEGTAAHDRKLGDVYKRFGGFDSINHFSDFGKFQKKDDGESTDAGSNPSDRLKRAGFDSIHHFSDFGRFNKRSVDRAYFARGYADHPTWKRRGFDSIHHYSDFGRFNRRK